MENLKSVKIHTLQAHLDRIQDTAEFVAGLYAGELLAERTDSAGDLRSIVVDIVKTKNKLYTVAQSVRTPEPIGNTHRQLRFF